MDNNKVTLPRDVAEALESLKSEWDDWGVVMRVKESSDHRADIVYNHFRHDLTEFLSALVNGYTIEQTPEEKVREYYIELYTEVNNGSFAPRREKAAELYGLEKTLDLLGIKIEGVNT